MNQKQLYNSPILSVRYYDDTLDICTASVPTAFDNDVVQDDVYGGLFN